MQMTGHRWNSFRHSSQMGWQNAWVTEKKKEGSWKDVRAYDSSDLEQWVEQSLPGQAWFANETGSPTQSVRSLDKCWTDWANVATPPLPGSLFSSAIEDAKRKLASRLAKGPKDPIVVAADSTDEALAFVAQCFGPEGSAELEPYRYQILVFDKAGVLPKLAGGTRPFIPVVHSREVELELAPYAEQLHSIVVYPGTPSTQSRISFSNPSVSKHSIPRLKASARTGTRSRA